jgi:NTE family protein
LVFSPGVVASAVHASIGVPGIFIPVRIGEEVYVDGGIVDPVPTDVLQEMGVRKIIAVNTIPTPEQIHQCLQVERELARLNPNKSRSLIRKLLPSKMYINHYTDGNVLEILMHSTHGAQMRLAEASSRRADIALHPDICDDRWMDFRNPGLYINAGREVALQHLDEIKSLLSRKGASHENEPAPKSLAKII